MPALPTVSGDISDDIAALRAQNEALLRRVQAAERAGALEPYAMVRRRSYQTGIANAVTTAVSWEVADEDPYAAWNPAAPTQLTLTQPGLIVGLLQLTFSSESTAGLRWGFLTRNTTDIAAAFAFGGNSGLGLTCTGVAAIRCYPGDVIRAYGYQNSGVTLRFQSDFGGSRLALFRLRV